MLGWLKRRAELASLRAATEDLDRFLARLQGATSEELGMVVAIATILRINFRNEGILPDAVLGVGLPATPDEEISTIIQLPRWIQLFQKEGQPSDAAGTMVWLHSVRVITLYPELRNKGREMWRELRRGFGHAPQALDDIQALSGKSIPTEAFEMVEFMPPPLSTVDTALTLVKKHLANFDYNLTEHGSALAPGLLKIGFNEAEVACLFAHATLARDVLEAGSNFLLFMAVREHGIALLKVLKAYKDAGELRHEHWAPATRSISNSIYPSEVRSSNIRDFLDDPRLGKERLATSRMDYEKLIQQSSSSRDA